MLRCECCAEELKIERVDGIWLCNSKPMGSESEVPSAAAFAEVLEQGHSGFCPWRSSQVVLNDPLRECDQAVADDVEKRRLGLLKGLRHIPVVSAEGKEVEDAAKALALAGWEFYESPEDQTEMFRCYICLRTHSVFAFLHRAVEPEDSGGGGEPPDKKQRTRPPPEVPYSSAWTPEVRVTSPKASQTDATTKGMFDPYTSHRFYCPLYCRPEGQLSPAAKRLLDAPMSQAPGGAASTSRPSGEPQVADTAASLLKALEEALPWKGAGGA